MDTDWAKAWQLHEKVLDTIPERLDHNRRIVAARAHLVTVATRDDPKATDEAISLLEAQLRQVQVAITYHAIKLAQTGQLEVLP